MWWGGGAVFAHIGGVWSQWLPKVMTSMPGAASQWERSIGHVTPPGPMGGELTRAAQHSSARTPGMFPGIMREMDSRGKKLARNCPAS